MLPSEPGSAQAAAIRTIRRIVIICAVVSVGGTIFVVYEFGFAAQPHRIGFACILAAAYLLWSLVGGWLMHRGWLRRVRKMQVGQRRASVR